MRSSFFKSLNSNIFLLKTNFIKLNKVAHTISFKNNGKSLSTYMLIGLGIFCSFYSSKNQLKCIQRALSKQTQSEVQIFQLNKYQLLELLTNVNQEMIFMIYSKYFRNQQEKEFAKKFQKLYIQAQELRVSKIYLIEKNDIKHLETFEKWLTNDKKQASQQKNSSKQVESKVQYFFLAPYFNNNPFKLQEEEINQEISQIRKFQIKFNPKINEQLFSKYRSQFNLTTVIKQCPQILSIKENECIEDFRNQIATLIQQKMLKNKSQDYAFYALIPNSKKDNSSILSFQTILKQYKSQQRQLPSGQVYESQDQKRGQNMYVLRNDILGRQIDNLKSFKRFNYSSLKSLNNYDKFLLFIRPRIFIISKANSSIDLYWYVTCLHKNKQPTISINNTDSFNLGKKFPVTNGLSYPQNTDMDFLKILYKNHSYLNFLIVNTQIASQLIRHLPVRQRYSIFSLTPDLMYPKMFLPNYDKSLTAQQNYNQGFKPLIEKYLVEPKNYDYVVLDKEKKVNRNELVTLMKSQNKKMVLRVCSLKCENDIQEEKLKIAFDKMQLLSSTPDGKVKEHWQNEVYRNAYWIDSHFNNVGLHEGDYLFSEGKFSQL